MASSRTCAGSTRHRPRRKASTWSSPSLGAHATTSGRRSPTWPTSPSRPEARRCWTSSWSAPARKTYTTSTTGRTLTKGRRWSRLTKARSVSVRCSSCFPSLALCWRASQPTPVSTRSCTRVAEFSFDVVSEFDPAELTNALDQARREVSTRYDFKDTQTILDRRDQVILIESASEERAKAALQVLREKAARRQLSPKLFKADDPKTVGKGRGQIEVRLNAGITDDLARDLRKRIQNVSSKVQVRIQGDQLRVVGKDKDTLQLVIKNLREAEDIPVPLQFTNYR